MLILFSPLTTTYEGEWRRERENGEVLSIVRAQPVEPVYILHPPPPPLLSPGSNGLYKGKSISSRSQSAQGSDPVLLSSSGIHLERVVAETAWLNVEPASRSSTSESSVRRSSLPGRHVRLLLQPRHDLKHFPAGRGPKIRRDFHAVTSDWDRSLSRRRVGFRFAISLEVRFRHLIGCPALRSACVH